MLAIVSYIKAVLLECYSHYNYNTTVQIITAWGTCEYPLKIIFLRYGFVCWGWICLSRQLTKEGGNKKKRGLSWELEVHIKLWLLRNFTYLSVRFKLTLNHPEKDFHNFLDSSRVVEYQDNSFSSRLLSQFWVIKSPLLWGGPNMVSTASLQT